MKNCWTRRDVLKSGRRGEELELSSNVYCPKERRRVPFWHCVGSFVQRRERCPHLIAASFNARKGTAHVQCEAKSMTDKKER